MGNKLREYADRHGLLTLLLNLKRVLKGYQPIFLDYPVDAKPRYGYGRPSHPEITAILAANQDSYARLLDECLSFSDELRRIPLQTGRDGLEPNWKNEYFLGLDVVALYALVASRKPALLIEIGSGQSTKIARLAIRTHGLETTLTSIDPHPRAEIDKLCDTVVRQSLETCDPTIFEQLGAGDILFFDGSHRVFMNSDATVFFLEVLPRLKPGVLVHIHDIFLPDDYVPWWEQKFYPHRYWSEQYLLAASLLAGHANYEVVLPNHYVSTTPALSSRLDAFWISEGLREVPRGGTSFWIQTR